MKIYTASKFSIVIVPPKLSEKTKESKLLVRSFRHIYKVVGLGVATGVSGLFSSTQLSQNKQIPVDDVMMSRGLSSSVESSQPESAKFLAKDESAEWGAASPTMSAESESQMDLDAVVVSENIEDSFLEPVVVATSDELLTSTTDLFIPFVIITLILGGLTAFYLYKYFKKSK